MMSTEGGVNYFMQELLFRLDNPEDPSTPPFPVNGVTTGVIVLAGAPNPTALAPVQQLMDLLFGPSAVKTAFERAEASIDVLVADAKTAVDVITGNARYSTYNNAMEPVTPDDPTSNVPFDP